MDMLFSKINIFEGEGIMVSNDENNEKKSQEVRKIIIDKYCL